MNLRATGGEVGLRRPEEPPKGGFAWRSPYGPQVARGFNRRAGECNNVKLGDGSQTG